MMTATMIQQGRILDYVDGPIVVEANGGDGRRYLCDLLDEQDEGAVFLVVPVTDEQVAQLNAGRSCMRRMMEVAGQEEWYISAPQWDFREPFTIERQAGPISESPDLCGEGYMLTGAWDDDE